MWNPLYREERPEALRELIAAHPLATVVTLGPRGLESSQAPLLYFPAEGTHGVLRGHLSRRNPQWRDYAKDIPVMAVFRGVDHYISPSWYASKPRHGKVVPTWNYVSVQAWGTMHVREESDWLLQNVKDLTETFERGRSEPWSVEDAPADFVASMLKVIVGIEIVLERIGGTRKLSQNREPADRAGAVAGLRTLNSERADEMARLVASGGDSLE